MAKKKKPFITPQAKQNGLIAFDKYLQLINLTNDFMMSQQQFVELCKLMGLGNENTIRNDVLGEMKRLELIKYCYIGKTQAKMILFTKISIRHIKNKKTSDEVASLRNFKSDTPKLLSVMKVKYIIGTVIPEMKKRNIDITTGWIQKFMHDAHSNLLLDNKSNLNYYEHLKKESWIGKEQETALNLFKMYSRYTSSRQKLLLNRELSEGENQALKFHETYFSAQREISYPAYKQLALIKDNGYSKVEEKDSSHKAKEKQLYKSFTEYNRLPTDPRLIEQFKKQNIFIQTVREDLVVVLLFNVKKTIREREMKGYMNSIKKTFDLIYGNKKYTIKFKILCLNEEEVNCIDRMFQKGDFTDINSYIDSFYIDINSLEIADEYLS